MKRFLLTAALIAFPAITLSHPAASLPLTPLEAAGTTTNDTLTDFSAQRRGGVAVRRGAYVGPRGGVAVRRGAVAVGPRGGVAVRRGGAYVGPGGGVAVRRGGAYVRPGYRGPVAVGGWARPANYWWRPGGAVAAGAALGFIGAATAAAWAGAAPAPGYCWYYTDPSRRAGFWDACP